MHLECGATYHFGSKQKIVVLRFRAPVLYNRNYTAHEGAAQICKGIVIYPFISLFLPACRQLVNNH